MRFEMTSVWDASGAGRIAGGGAAAKYFEVIQALGFACERGCTGGRVRFYVEIPTFADLVHIVRAIAKTYGDYDGRVIIDACHGDTPELEIYDYPDD